MPAAYFLYARKSTEEEDRQVLSIDAQLHELRTYAQREGLTIAEEFIEAKTAKQPGRPVFNLMIEQVEMGKAAGLLAWHSLPGRLARKSRRREAIFANGRLELRPQQPNSLSFLPVTVQFGVPN